MDMHSSSSPSTLDMADTLELSILASPPNSPVPMHPGSSPHMQSSSSRSTLDPLDTAKLSMSTFALPESTLVSDSDGCPDRARAERAEQGQVPRYICARESVD